MRKWAARSLALGISRDGIALVLCEGWRHPKKHLLFEGSVAQDVVGHVPALSTLIHDALVAHCPNTSLCIRAVVSDDLVRFFMVTPPSNATTWRDCESASLMRFELLYDAPTTGWTVRSCPHANFAFLSCAIPTALIQTISLASIERRAKLASLQPLFTVGWNRWAKQKTATGWMGSGTGEGLTLGIVQQQRLVAVLANPFALNTIRDASQLNAHLSLEATRFSVNRPTRLDLFVPTGGDDKWRDGRFNEGGMVSVHRQTVSAKGGDDLKQPTGSAWLASAA